MKRIAILTSNIGTGTNLQAIIDGVLSGKIKAQIAAVVSDTPDALGINRAKKYNIPIKICPKKERLLPFLKNIKPDYICLAGWKQIVLDEVIDAFPNRILNTHPGLIPDEVGGVVKNPDGTDALWNKGKMTDKAIQNNLSKKTSYAGCTNHFLSHEFDFGPVLGRCFEKIRPGDTVDSLYTRLKVKENKLYVEVLSRLCSNYVREAKESSAYSNKRKKTVLITDAGGRGAALVDKYGQSKHIGKILVVPGNDLMQINTCKPVVTYQHLKTTSVPEILEICKKEQVSLVDVAQDNAIEVGLVDELNRLSISAIGPTRIAGQIEWDKQWARDFMKRHDISSPEYYSFSSQKEAIKFVKNNPRSSWFVKASGLAEGKGAIPASNIKEAVGAIKQMSKFGKSGETFLLEEYLLGEEFSAFAFCDGTDFQIVGFVQDHKRVNDNELGENTGGMGCVSNPLVVTSSVKEQVEDIFRKTISGLKKEMRLYKGVLYLGGMLVQHRVYVIEFNARWGDPEAQVLLPSIKNDLYEIALSIISGKIKNLKIKTDKTIRVAVAGTSKGYPLDYQAVKGKKVFGINRAVKTGVKIYGAGIKKVGANYVVSGGRVLYTVGEGKNMVGAREKAYKAMALISIEGNNLHYRTDIGWRDVERMRKAKE